MHLAPNIKTFQIPYSPQNQFPQFKHSTNSPMATQQEEGWPLGLRPLDVRGGNGRIMNHSVSLSYTTLLTSSPSRCSNSTCFDSESSGSFSPGQSVTLGRLMGVTNITDLSNRSSRVRRTAAETSTRKLNCKSRNWCFLLCSKLNTDAINMRNAPSLAHFLQAERKTATVYKRRHNPLFCSSHGIQHGALLSEENYIH